MVEGREGGGGVGEGERGVGGEKEEGEFGEEVVLPSKSKTSRTRDGFQSRFFTLILEATLQKVSPGRVSSRPGVSQLVYSMRLIVKETGK